VTNRVEIEQIVTKEQGYRHDESTEWDKDLFKHQTHHPRPQRKRRFVHPSIDFLHVANALWSIGVGKSSVTLQLALTLYLKGFRVGVLDIDLTGPSMPRMLGLEGQHIHQSSTGWIPVYLNSPGTSPGGQLSCMSIGFLLRDRGDSVVWRGPKKASMIGQFLEDVVWGDLDYLLIDTPPGKSVLPGALADSKERRMNILLFLRS
jgi:NUBPL iron-transfer P-loop NTPase